MSIATTDELVAALSQSRLLQPSQVETLSTTIAPQFSDPRELAKHLIQLRWLTPFQINQIYNGNAPDLILGQYHLLERIGEGAMGQVFKARHQRMDRIVALKVMRKDRLDNPEAVKRFRREVQAAGQLAHPNIVRAFDADEVGSTQFFAMEYVEGIDVARLVRDHGPMPIDLACEFVRQAALGLQHAMECGLVHRDIKPANLLIAFPSTPRGAAPTSSDEPFRWEALRGGTTKILDMGMARLRHGPTGSALSQLTQEGTVMGTPDFIAPEQAINSSTADIRADLYSLGCTFYFMLAGQVPFPGGTMMEKVLKHRVDHPTPLERLRPDVPRGVLEVVRRMLAKKPEERFARPAEVAAALAPFCQPGGGGRAGSPENSSPLPDDDPERVIADIALDQTGSSAARRFVAAQARPRRRWLSILVGTLLLAALGVGLAAWFSREPPPPPPPLTPLERLDRAEIPADLRARLPEAVAAVFGKPDGQYRTLCVALSGDGRRLAFSGDDAQVHLIDLASGRETFLRPALVNHVVSIIFSPDGQALAAASLSGEVRLWDLHQGMHAAHLVHPLSDQAINQVAFVDGGATLATAGDDRTLKLWQVRPQLSSQPLLTHSFNLPVLGFAFSADGKALATVCRGERTLRFWTRTEREELKRAGQTELGVGAISTLAWSRDGKFLAVGGDAKQLVLATMNGTGIAARRPLGAKQAFEAIALAFSPDSRRLAAGDDEGRVRVWDLVGRDHLLLDAHLDGARIRGIAFAPDNIHFATANGDGSVTIFRLPPPSN